MAKVIFSMTDGVPHGDDYVAPTGDTPVGLGVVEGKSYFSIDDAIQLLQLMVQTIAFTVFQ